MPQGERRLAAIMFTDLVGFTALGQRDESLSLALVEEYRKLLRPIFTRHNGREVKSMGDGFLVEFSSALDAIRGAYEIQRAAREFNISASVERRLHIRVGVHLGDVIESQGDISGDAVNVASRIEPLAEDGGVCLTRPVYDLVQNRFELPLTSLGIKPLKNVSVPIEIYKVVMPWDEGGESPPTQLDRKRIAVLPLINISPEPSDEYFAIGLTEELIDRLSRLEGLKVIARTSIMKYKTKERKASEIGRELGVETLVDGSVRKVGNKVRVAVQLINAATEEQIWSSRYDRDLDDIFAVQSDIAENVAHALDLRILPLERGRVTGVPTKDPEAHILYLKGRHHWYARTEDGVAKAIKYFEEAVSRDPAFALAFVGLADCYSILGVFGFRRPSLVYPKARELALAALKLDDDLAEAHASMGEVLMHYYHDWSGAEQELERAIKLNPNYAQAHVWRSTWFAAHCLMEEAISEARLAEELDPLSVVVMNELSKDLYYARRYDDAIAQFRRSLEVEPDSAYLHKGLAETYAQKSMSEESIAEAEKAITISGNSIFILCAVGYVYAASGRRDKAERVLRELDRLSSEEFVPSFGRATIYAGLGEEQAALEWLEKAYDERAFLIWLKTDPIFDRLRGEEKFKTILQKMNLS
ncbi:MAG TPA: adenylate/guanylate cyclase domain-containing protein [Conexivisphaerales archaeon]|nr:adenylate/guanylate cyclase domain-containing protein [Conexivisphaerales archaeon]